jgi:hypothetical protein
MKSLFGCMFVTFALSFSATGFNHVMAQANGVKVISARWGTKDVTAKVAAFCDQKETCDYRVSKRFLGKHGGWVKSFEISWICHGLPETQENKKLSANAENKNIQLDCSKIALGPLKPQDPTSVETSFLPKEINQDTVAYYQDLLDKFERDPKTVKLVNFNQTFYPMAPVPADERLVSCTLNQGRGYCGPDTFYSWGPKAKLDNLKAATSYDTWRNLNNGRYIYMNHSPIGSYCYGEYPVRLKFKQTPKRGPLNDGTFAKTFNEWIVKDGRTIDSISFAQPEHIDEIITEIYRRLDSKAPWYKGALYLHFGSLMYNNCVPEVLKLSEENLVRNVMLLIKAYLNGESWLHAHHCQGNCGPEDSAEHFKTNWKTFFNPA